MTARAVSAQRASCADIVVGKHPNSTASALYQSNTQVNGRGYRAFGRDPVGFGSEHIQVRMRVVRREVGVMVPLV
jgi:hypothetical protein